MERKKSWLALLATVLLCCSACLPAHASDSEKPRVPIGSTLATTAEEAQINEDREQIIKQFYALHANLIEAEEAPADIQDAHACNDEGTDPTSSDPEDALQLLPPSACSHCGSKQKLAVFGYDVYPDGYLHHVLFCSAGGYTAELEDGSIWRVNDYDSAKLYNWFPQDEISICPSSMLSSDPFYFYNSQTRESVGVRLQLGPFYDSAYTRWVVAINSITREVWLNDGAHFVITGDDALLMSEWLPGHTVIIGTNTGLASYKWPNILINVNTYNPLKIDPNPFKRNPLYVQARWVY